MSEKTDADDNLVFLVSLPDDILAKSLCEAMGEDVHHKGDDRGNDWRWEDYIECVDQFKKSINFYTRS